MWRRLEECAVVHLVYPKTVAFLAIAHTWNELVVNYLACPLISIPSLADEVPRACDLPVRGGASEMCVPGNEGSDPCPRLI